MTPADQMDIYSGQLINWVLQKTSTLIGKLATVHICDWLTKVQQIYEPSWLLVHGWPLPPKVEFYTFFNPSLKKP